MPPLTAKRRARLAPTQFAGPGRTYPINDMRHAVNAKARATQQEQMGNLSAAQAARIRARANRKLGGGRGMPVGGRRQTT